MVICKSCKNEVAKGLWSEIKGIGGKKIVYLYCSEKCAVEHLNWLSKQFCLIMEEEYKKGKITKEEFEKLKKLQNKSR